MFEQAGVGVARVSPEGPFVEINDRYCEILGRSREEVIGGGWREITHPDDLAMDVANVEALLAGKRDSYSMEKRYIRPDGTAVWVDMAVVLTRDADGSPAYFIPVVQDIDARKAAEHALGQLNRNLELRVEERTASLAQTARALEAEMERRETIHSQLVQAQKMEALGQLVGGVAHDFNNVLAAIQSAFMLLEHRVTGDDAKFVVAEGRKAGDRATALIKQMLAFARRETVSPKLIDLGALLPGLREMLSHAAGAVVDCEVRVEQGTYPVLADPQQLEVSLLNLAINARDAMPTGGRMIISAANLGPNTPRPAALGSGDAVAISVRDTGSGMDAVTVGRALEPFSTTKSVGKGTGLGLAQVHGLIARASGALTIESEVGQGTVVTLFLPRAAFNETLVSATSELSTGRVEAMVLLVDDDDEVRPITAAFLRELGHSVIEASSAAIAMAMAELHAIDVLVTDVVMPDTDGPALVRQMRAIRPDLPVVYVTGYAGDRVLDDGEVVTKPFAADDITKAIERAVSP